jgi:hypothetical protein
MPVPCLEQNAVPVVPVTDAMPQEGAMPEPKQSHKGQPEALATLAAAAINGGKKPDNDRLTATRETVAIPTPPGDKDDAATKVLREGVLGMDQGTRAAIDKLPDRARDNRPKKQI